MQKAKRTGLFCLLLLLIASAICSFIYQLVQGLSVTGLHEPVVWGVYVVNFTFCLAVAAGILMVLVVISGSDVINAPEKLLLCVITLVSLAIAGIFIILDLGRIDRFYYLIIYPQPKSPLFWDFIITNIFATITIVFCFTSLRQIFLGLELNNDAPLWEKFIYKAVTVKKNISTSKTLKTTVRVFTLILVTGAYLVTTEVFTGFKARPQWHSPMFSLAFLSSSILCGISVFILIKKFCEQSESSYSYKRAILFLLAVDAVIMLAKYYVDKSNPLIEEVYSLFPFSLLVFLVIGNIIPILLILFFKTDKPALYRLVPTLVLVGVLLKRAELIIPAYFKRWLPFASDVSYRPTFHEMSIVIGVYSAAIVVLMIAFYFAKFLVRRSSAVQTL